MTLDEAIRHCEEVAENRCDECGMEHRQLSEWLKELKERREADGEKNRTDNLPLSWEELKSMQGKPIWVEYEGYIPGWEIIKHIGIYKWTINSNDDEVIIETNSSILHEEEQGKTWQAYKKEKI